MNKMSKSQRLKTPLKQTLKQTLKQILKQTRIASKKPNEKYAKS